MLEDAQPLRFRVEARDQLRADSDVKIDQVRTIGNARIAGNALTVLSENEIATIEEYLSIVLGLGD